MNKFFTLLTTLLIFSCTSVQKETATIPSWYLTPKQNDSAYLYGVAEGHSLEESTRFALADAAARLMVSISSTSTLLREENQNSVNEEMRQNVRQNIEKIDFSNFEVTKTATIGKQFYAEIKIEREPFLRDQKERLQVIETKLTNLEKNNNFILFTYDFCSYPLFYWF